MSNDVHTRRKVRSVIKNWLISINIVSPNRYFCRSVEYDEKTKQCSLSEEDSVSQKDDIINHSSPTHNFYDLICLDNCKHYFNF